jgi:hypothetical protein
MYRLKHKSDKVKVKCDGKKSREKDCKYSKNMVDFMKSCKRVYSYKIRKRQSDNGYENMKEFSKILNGEKIQ